MLAGRTPGVGCWLKVFGIVVVLGLVFGEALADEVYRDERCAVVDVALDPRIGFGEEADKEDWPWHGALFYGKRYKCGCTLVNEWFVLTAAHCCFNPDTGYSWSVALLRVKLGVFVLKQQYFDERIAWEYEVESVRVHPEFATSGHRHDLALMLLNKKVELNQFVQPIALDGGDSSWIELSAGMVGTVVGWGLTENDTLSNELRLAQMPIVRYVDCVMSNPAVFGQLIHTGMFCAGAKNGSSVCNGDSGGGMYVSRDGQWKLQGVVSFGATRDGTNLCDLYSFAVFVNVPHYGEWIRKELDCFDRQARESRLMDPETNVDLSTTTSTPTTTTLASSTTPLPPNTRSASPECFQQFNKVITVERNSSISLVCNYEPNSTIHSIRWTREIGEYHQQVELSTDLTYGEPIRNDILTLLHLDAAHSGRYSCAVEYANRTVLDNRTVSVIGVIPRFDRGAYMAFPIRIRRDYFNLELIFRVEKLSGTLFHAEDSCGKQFVNVELIDGKVVFAFATEGNTTRQVTSIENGIQLGQWHKIDIKILHGKGFFLLDKRLQELFNADIAAESCKLGQDYVYLGGYENSVDSGLIGCISALTLNDDRIDLWKSASRIQNVSQCLPCSENHCQNGGICVESVGSEPVQCLCEEGFVGARCSNRGTGCSSHPCLDGTCKDEEEGFRCICPNDRTGRFCEAFNFLSGEALQFRSHGYALYRITSTPDLQVRFRVKINAEQHSLIAFLSKDSYDANNGFALVLIGNQLQLQIFQEMEVKPLVLQSTVLLRADNWSSILIELYRKEVFFQVDDEAALLANVSAGSVHSDRNLYLGGLDDHVKSYRFNGSPVGFNGCIGELTISNVALNMSTSFINAKNVENCH